MKNTVHYWPSWFLKRVKMRKKSTRSSSNKRTKTLYKGYLHCIANFFATVFNIFSKEIISNNTKKKKKVLKFIKTRDSTVQKLIMKYYSCWRNFYELWNLYFRVPVENCFWCYFRKLYISLANIIRIILVFSYIILIIRFIENVIYFVPWEV